MMNESASGASIFATDEGAAGVVLHHAREVKGAPVGGHVDARREHGGCEDGFGEVLECVGTLHLVGAHGAGEYDRAGRRMESCMQQFAGDAQGVGAVQNHHAVAVVGTGQPGNGVEDAASVLIRQVEAVLAEQGKGGDAGVFQPEASEHEWDDASDVGEGALALVIGFFDGPAGRDQMDVAHEGESSRHWCRAA